MTKFSNYDPPALWRPDWPAPPSVQALCTTRAGGVSLPPCDSLNLGGHVGDDPAAVAENRRRLQDAMAARPVFMQQVHGKQVLVLDAGSADGQPADAAITGQRGVACTVMVADCLPVLFCDSGGRRVAAAHAGWRGLAGGVLDQVVDSFGEQQSAASDLMAWLGPCIGPQRFEVGDEVKAAFAAQDAGSGDCFVPTSAPGKWLADLPALARRRLAALGVRSVWGNDSSVRWCTVQNPSVFFSYRRDGQSGRFAACIWRV